MGTNNLGSTMSDCIESFIYGLIAGCLFQWLAANVWEWIKGNDALLPPPDRSLQRETWSAQDSFLRRRMREGGQSLVGPSRKRSIHAIPMHRRPWWIRGGRNPDV